MEIDEELFQDFPAADRAPNYSLNLIITIIKCIIVEFWCLRRSRVHKFDKICSLDQAASQSLED